MHQTLRGLDPDRLERSCTPRTNTIRFGAGAPGLERAEMRFASCRFSPHRHDTYAIGVTTAGVQEFRYRGRRHICLPGQLHFLYPDETHDGGPATDAGFAYRILYAEPELVRDALGGRPLPFVAEPVQDGTPATRELRRLLDQIDDPVSDLGRHEAASAIAEALLALGGGTQREGRIDLTVVARVRSYIAAHASDQTPASTLERIAGTDRYAIARQFRRAYGTSPDRYRTMRRLALARTAIEEGVPLARAAADCGFADQSHMTRQFVRAYGLTPGRWAAIAAVSGPPSEG